MPSKNAKHRDAQVLMYHLWSHASCTKTLAEPHVESVSLTEPSKSPLTSDFLFPSCTAFPQSLLA